MPPAIATLLTLIGVLYLLRREALHGEVRSAALWLPVMWLGITGSRFLSQWMDLGGGAGDNFTEGSFIDALYFSALIGAGLWTLQRRGVRVGAVIRANGWVFALVAYGLVSILWSDFPLTAGKRWIKTLGHPVMALIMLTEPDPAAAVRTALKRCVCIHSVTNIGALHQIFAGIWPRIRCVDWRRGEQRRGATKNDLGYVCMTSGIVFVWDLLTVHRITDRRSRRAEIIISAGMLMIVAWLL